MQNLCLSETAKMAENSPGFSQVGQPFSGPSFVPMAKSIGLGYTLRAQSGLFVNVWLHSQHAYKEQQVKVGQHEASEESPEEWDQGEPETHETCVQLGQHSASRVSTDLSQGEPETQETCIQMGQHSASRVSTNLNQGEPATQETCVQMGQHSASRVSTDLNQGEPETQQMPHQKQRLGGPITPALSKEVSQVTGSCVTSLMAQEASQCLFAADSWIIEGCHRIKSVNRGGGKFLPGEARQCLLDVDSWIIEGCQRTKNANPGSGKFLPGEASQCLLDCGSWIIEGCQRTKNANPGSGKFLPGEASQCLLDCDSWIVESCQRKGSQPAAPAKGVLWRANDSPWMAWSHCGEVDQFKLSKFEPNKWLSKNIHEDQNQFYASANYFFSVKKVKSQMYYEVQRAKRANLMSQIFSVKKETKSNVSLCFNQGFVNQGQISPFITCNSGHFELLKSDVIFDKEITKFAASMQSSSLKNSQEDSNVTNQKCYLSKVGSVLYTSLFRKMPLFEANCKKQELPKLNSRNKNVLTLKLFQKQNSYTFDHYTRLQISKLSVQMQVSNNATKNFVLYAEDKIQQRECFFESISSFKINVNINVSCLINWGEMVHIHVCLLSINKGVSSYSLDM